MENWRLSGSNGGNNVDDEYPSSCHVPDPRLTLYVYSHYKIIK